MSISKKTGLLIGAALLFGGSIADADPYVPPSQYGIGVVLGGGVQDFTNSDMRSTTTPGGNWDVRAMVGTRSPIAIEAAYIGSAQGIESRFGTAVSATLIGTGLEADLRVNLIPFENITPFGFAGLGWKRYDVRGEDFTTADTGIRDDDQLLEIPLGAGVGYRYAGLSVDARFTYRVAAGEDLVVAADVNNPDVDTNAGSLGMDTWGVGANLGMEF